MAAKVAIGGVIAAFAIFYILTSPDQAATIVEGMWHLTVKIVKGIGDFIDKVTDKLSN